MRHSSWLCCPHTGEEDVFTDLDFADDVAVMSDMLECFVQGPFWGENFPPNIEISP